MKQYRIAYVCTHNSCRSQMAEAITKIIADDLFIPYSAGTCPNKAINQDAVRTIKEIYNVDMRNSQYPKQLLDIPEVDIVITMGCGVDCPMIKCLYREDWGLDDPTGKAEEAFFHTAALIKNNILHLKNRIEDKIIVI